MSFVGDSVLVLAPVAPGDKELLLQYELPPEQRRLVVALSADSVDLFLEEAGVTPPNAGWSVSDSQAFEGRRFRRLSRRDPKESVLNVRFPGLAINPDRLVPWLVGGFALVLVAATLATMRGRGEVALAPTHDHPMALADQIARLDLSMEATTDTEQLARAKDRRAELKARLERALARRGVGS